MERFDVAIIGAGPGGYEAALYAAGQGWRVALIEKNELGGTCLNRGCIPTKTLLHTAEIYQDVVSHGEALGLVVPSITLDGMRLQARKNEVVDTLRAGVAQLMKQKKVTVIFGVGQITGPQEVTVHQTAQEEAENGQLVLTADRILIATGSAPAWPPIQGSEWAETSDTMLDKTEYVHHLIIIGGGVIGMEFAALYAALGRKVTVIEAMPRVLATMDKEFAQNIKMILSKKGVTFITKARVQRIVVENGLRHCYCTVDGQEEELHVEGDVVLMAVGRRPVTESLWTEQVPISLDKGFIVVDDTYQTSCPGVYAIGDVIGGAQLAHVATAEGINAICHMRGETPKYDTSVIPSCVYTNPEMATVGLTAEEAKAQGLAVRTLKYPMSANGKSVLAMEERGFIKVIVEEKSGMILGAQLMCARATDMITQFTEAIVQHKTVKDMAPVIYPHPTFNEGIGHLW